MLLPCLVCKGQNLVLNGDFEQYSACPTYFAQLVPNATFWQNPSTNQLGVSGTPDYFNQCSFSNFTSVPTNNWGYQLAHSGQAYCGLALFLTTEPNYREYIEGTLSSPLVADSCYTMEFYINKGNTCKRATDAFGVYFSDFLISGINNYLPLPFVPQLNNVTGNFITDTANWVLFSQTYTAHGGETHFIIGNFKNDSNTNIILTDNIGVSDDGYVYIDDVSLVQTVCLTGINSESSNSTVQVFPNPIVDKLFIKTGTNSLSEIILYDIASRNLLQQKFMNSVSINTEQLAKGIYLYEVRNKNGVIKKGKVVKD
jgi:Secretion system C-terminal sorting domain